MASHSSISDYYQDDHNADDYAHEDHARRKTRAPMRQRDRSRERPSRRPPRTERDQAFRCLKCRQFIGAPLTGGRHRNHCPNCLHSRHVDLKQPGDRRSECGSLMAPEGLLIRRNGEQQIVHTCLGCGKVQPTRVAADDNPVLVMRIPLVGSIPQSGGEAEYDAEASTSEEIA